jgi:serine/threonine protein kinase/tetratricopeptide (TPR) repeat protein
MNTHLRDEADVFARARAITEAEARRVFLDEACCGDEALRRRIEALLRAHERPGNVLDSPLVADLGRTGAYLISVEAGTVIARRYRLLEKIGEGGMGTVWTAEQIEPVKREVAVKLIKPGMDSVAVLRRFEAERQALAMMDHPHIAKVLDGGLTEFDRPYFVMEYVKGLPITECCDAARLSIAERLRLFARVCRAVQHAHQKGIIHRDLKPSNILVTTSDEAPAPKVIDFGLAKAVNTPLTDQTLYTTYGTIMGTALYMSPEQALRNNLDVDTRSDVYSLGVVLYELLTGTTPLEQHRFHDAGWEEIRRLIRDEEPVRPSARLHTNATLTSVAACRQCEPARLPRLLRGELDCIVMKAVAKDRSQRYDTADSLARDIERYLNDEPVEARPPTAGYQLAKFVRRNRRIARSVAAVFLALVAGVLGTSWGLVRAERARVDADNARLAATEDRRLAEANEKTAKLRQAETRAVLDFVENKVFAAARPEGKGGGLGHDVTLRKAVETALPYVDQAFRDQPLIEAQLRLTLGLSFLYLGSANTASEQFQRALTIYTAIEGPRHPDTLMSMHRLAGSYFALGRHTDALALNQETLALRQEVLGTDHPDTLASMNSVANAYRNLGQHENARKLYEETLALRKAKLGPDHPDTLASMNNLAVNYTALNRHAEALQLNEETLGLKKAKLGPDHPDTLITMINLAVNYSALGRFEDALKIREETTALLKAKLGAKHPDTLLSMHNLANSYASCHRLGDALNLHEETLALRQKELGIDHPDTLVSMAAVANALAEVDRGAEAITIVDDCLRLAVGKDVDPRLFPTVFETRLRYFAKIKDTAGCRTTCERWEQLHRADANSLYFTACCHAITAAVIRVGDKSDVPTEQANAEADRAMDWLRQALAAGYRDVTNLKQDADLDALREREDFKKLSHELEAKGAVEAK